MFNIVKATLAAAIVTLGVAATQSQPANAFVAPAPNVITVDGSLATNISCGGIDCDHPSQRGYGYKRRNGGEWGGYKRRKFRSHRGYQRHGRRYDPNWRQRRKERQVRRAVRQLMGAVLDRRW